MGEEAPVSYAEPGPPCILFIRFHEDCLQRLKNSLTQGKSVLKIHGGEMIGIGEQVSTQTTIAIIYNYLLPISNHITITILT